MIFETYQQGWSSHCIPFPPNKYSTGYSTRQHDSSNHQQGHTRPLDFPAKWVKKSSRNMQKNVSVAFIQQFKKSMWTGAFHCTAMDLNLTLLAIPSWRMRLVISSIVEVSMPADKIALWVVSVLMIGQSNKRSLLLMLKCWEILFRLAVARGS